MVTQVKLSPTLISYWTNVLKPENGGEFSWYDFRKKYMEFGGDGIYAAWLPNYLEPAFRNHMFYPKGCPTKCPYFEGRLQKYTTGLCPVAESIQTKLLQLKTNYFNLEKAEQQADILLKTVKYFTS